MLKNNKNFKLSTREKSQSQRQLQVSQLVNLSIVDCLRKGKRISPLLYGCPVTITKVNISADLQVVNCFFLPFNTSFSSDEILDALKSSSYEIRAYVTRHVHLKYSPEIRFYYDSTFENVAHIESLLSKDA